MLHRVEPQDVYCFGCAICHGCAPVKLPEAQQTCVTMRLAPYTLQLCPIISHITSHQSSLYAQHSVQRRGLVALALQCAQPYTDKKQQLVEPGCWCDPQTVVTLLLRMTHLRLGEEVTAPRTQLGVLSPLCFPPV